jgi:hypothetical protein
MRVPSTLRPLFGRRLRQAVDQGQERGGIGIVLWGAMISLLILLSSIMR